MYTRSYTNLREHLEKLEQKGLLVRVKREINKDTELHPLVRWQFRSNIPESERKGFLFENVSDAKGKHYDFPVALGVLLMSSSSSRTRRSSPRSKSPGQTRLPTFSMKTKS